MFIIGHRGAAGLAPENTILGIKTAVENRADAIEFDVRVTADKKLVLCHDDTFLRIAGKSDRVRDLSLNQIRKIETNSGEPIPTLEEAIKAAGKTPLVIEGKSDDWARPLANILKTHKTESPRVISYNHRELFLFSELMPGIDTFAIENHHPIEAMLLAKNLRFTGVSLAAWLYNPIVYHLSKKYKLELITSPLNPRWRIRLFHFLYPRAMITTDFPDRVINHNLRRRRKRK
ncbi:hypothetical protein HZB74_02895 [Candidatus Saccharibacteria bacterium]|nr:hypothetical protein [Candidatus Saccharibacteria bacterium]